jgi:hypothetical protein
MPFIYAEYQRPESLSLSLSLDLLVQDFLHQMSLLRYCSFFFFIHMVMLHSLSKLYSLLSGNSVDIGLMIHSVAIALWECFIVYGIKYHRYFFFT